MCRSWNIARPVDLGSACMDSQSPLTQLLKFSVALNSKGSFILDALRCSVKTNLNILLKCSIHLRVLENAKTFTVCVYGNYSHMPIGKVWICRFCVCVCLYSYGFLRRR